MKVIIVEGTDNTGKDTLINEIKNCYQNTLIVHCGKPCGISSEENAEIQNEFFNKYLTNLKNHIYDDVCDVIIFNRAWYGEYVYGSLYRQRDKYEIQEFLEDFEQELLSIPDVEVYYVQLVCNSVKLLKENDDGLSISNKIENIVKETKLFKEVFNLSNVKHKKIINVDENDEFRPRLSIFMETCDLILDA